MKWSRHSCLCWHSLIHPFATSLSLSLVHSVFGIAWLDYYSSVFKYGLLVLIVVHFHCMRQLLFFPAVFFSRISVVGVHATNETFDCKCNGAFKSMYVEREREIIRKKRSFPSSHWSNYSVASWTQIHNSIMSKFSLLIFFLSLNGHFD